MSRGGQRRYLAVAGGFLEVLPGHVRVLADVAERAEDIDAARAGRRFNGPRNRPAATTRRRALAALERAQARIAAAERK